MKNNDCVTNCCCMYVHHMPITDVEQHSKLIKCGRSKQSTSLYTSYKGFQIAGQNDSICTLQGVQQEDAPVDLLLRVDIDGNPA